MTRSLDHWLDCIMDSGFANCIVSRLDLRNLVTLL